MSVFVRNLRDSDPAYALRGAEKPETIFLAEGLAEAWFLEMWLRRLGKDAARNAVICFKGLSRIKLAFRNIVEGENFDYVKRIGFFLDAEANPAKSRVESIENLLRHHGLATGQDRLHAGQVSRLANHEIALFVSPDNSQEGCIEQVVLNEIQTREFSECVIALKECVERTPGRTLHPKAMVNTYIGIATKGLCGTSHGFESGLFDPQHAAYRSIWDTFSPIIS